MRNFKNTLRPITLITVILLVNLYAHANNYYWVGGSGNWSDFSNHWATTSGGSTFHTQVPTSNDDVFFDANSFTAAGQIVNANNTVVFFRSMNWTGASNSPQFLQSTTSSSINVFGSLTLIAAMNWNVSGSVIFLSNTTGNTITSGGKIFKNRVDFEGSGGGWTLQDALSIDGSAGVTNSGLLNLNFGTLNTNGKNVTCLGFQSSNSNVRSLLMDNTLFVVNYNNGSINAWNTSSVTNLTLSAVGSTIEIGGTYPYPSFSSNSKIYNNLLFTNSNALQASIGGSGNTFNGNVTFSGISTGTGGNTFNGNLTFLGDGQITSNNIINGTLNFTPGKTYILQAGVTQTISATGTMNAAGSCVLPINIKSSTNGSQATISKINGNLNVDQVILQDIRAQLSPTFTANATNSFDAGNNSNWIFPPFSGADMYWVGGTGNWNDPNHWSFSSGGVAGTCIPGPGNNVFFDANSFTNLSKTVTVNVSTANCKNMTWIGAGFTPSFNSSSTTNTLKIYGSLTLIAAMNLNYNGNLSFEAKTTGNTITSAGKIWQMNNPQTVFFNGIGGNWSFQDPFNTIGLINLVNGSLSTNNQNVTCFYFESQNSNVRTLDLGSSTWICNGYYWMVNNGTNLTLNAGTSTIKLLYCCFSYFYGGGKTYNNVSIEGTNGNSFYIFNNNTFNGSVTFLGDGYISENNIFNGNLIFSPGRNYILYSGTTQTISATGSLVANGACTNYISIKSLSTGFPATINKVNGNLTVDNTILQDITATVTIGFLATATNKSIDAGGNTNWNFSVNPVTALYWIGGAGNWNDPNHWSLTSGGAPGSCIPGPTNDVYFDANSFTNASKTVTVNVTNALCKNMNWTGAGFTPTLTYSISGSLKIYGSLTLISAMNFNYGAQIYFESRSVGNTVITAGKSIPGQVNFNGLGGGWTLMDGLTTTNYLYLAAGTLNTNNQPVSCLAFESSSGQVRSLNLGSTVFTITNYHWNISSPFNMSLNSGTSNIRFLNQTSGYGMYGGGLIYYNVNFESGTTYPVIQNNNTFNGTVTFNNSGQVNGINTFNSDVIFNGDGVITANNTYNKTLKFSPGKTYTLTSNVTQTFSNTGTLNAVGTPCAPIAIFSSVNGTYTNFSKASGEVCGDYLYLTYARATGGATFSAGTHSTSTPASGTGWQFISCSGALQSALITASGPLCGGGSITLSSRPAASYLWSTGATTQSIIISSPGTYSLSIVNLNGCAESGSLAIVNSAPPTCSINGSATACPATSETYSAPAGMSSYAWSVSGNATIPGSAIGQSVSVTPTGCGSYVLTLTITNSSGCSSTCTTTVTVQDNIAPTITCPSNITVANATGLCGKNVSFSVTASDNCGTPTVVSSPASGFFFPVGTTTVTSVATDACGNTSACSFTVTVTGGIDTDEDGSPDVCDTDDDNDGVLDINDNCPLVSNTNQLDTDNDGIGNVCDPDDDNDGILDVNDNCQLVANANQLDTDNDGIGNVCDPDDDNDGVADASDNCPFVSNPEQEDNDGDALGDICDSDDDNDGILDVNDNCSLVSNSNQLDTDNDGIGNICDPDDDNDGILDENDCAPLVASTPIVVTAVASNNATGAVAPQAMIFSGAGQNVTFVGQGPGHKVTGGRTNIYSNINTSSYGGLWWTFTPIENPRHSSQGATGQMLFNSYDPVTRIITFTSTANMIWQSVNHTENIATRLRMQLQPYTGTHTGPIATGLPFVTAGGISLGSLSANYPLIDIKALGSPAAYQVWYIVETASGVPLDVYYGDPAHNSSVGGQTVTSQTGSFFSSTLSTCNGGPATVTVTATGGTGPYIGTGVFSAAIGEHTYTVTDANGCSASSAIDIVPPTPIVVTAVASNNATGPVAAQAMIFSGAGQNVTFVGQGPGHKVTGGRTNIYSNINTSSYGGLWWTFTPIENPRHSSQGSSTTGQMVFNSYDPVTRIITFTSTANMIWQSVNHTENIATRLRMQLQPYTGTHSGPIATGLPFVTAGDISLGSLSANYPLIDIKALGSPAAYQVWYIIETASGVPLDVYYGDPAHNSSVGGQTVTSQTGSFFSSTLSTCNGGPATVTVTATGGTGPYIGTGVFSAAIGEHTYTVTDANGCTGSANITVVPPTPIVVTAVASNNVTGPVALQAMIFSGGGQNVTFVGQGPGHKVTGGRTNIYSNINTSSYGGLWWTFTPIENPRHSSQGATGQMVFNSYDPVTRIITFTSTANMIWQSVNHTENIATRLRMQLQPYTGTHSGPIATGLPFVTAGGISLGSLSANYPLIDIKALGSPAAYQVWYIIETASGLPLDVYYGDPAHNSSVGGQTVTSQTGSFFSSTLSTCNGGPATVTVTATGGTGPYVGTGVFSAAIGEHTYTVTDANGCSGSATIDVEGQNCIELLCVENKIVSTDAGSCVATVMNIDPIITPPNAIVNYKIEKGGIELETGVGSVSGKTFAKGISTVTYTAVDEPTKTCSFTVTVMDNEKPTFICPGNQNINLNATCQLIVPNLIAGLTSSDNCGTVTFTQSPIAGASFAALHNQTHNVVITASDGNGNTQTCTVILTGKDVTQPTFNCPSNQNVTLNATCQLIVPNLIAELSGNDNCGTVTFTQIPLAGASLVSSHNQTHNVVITASDGNGNTKTCTVVLIGKDVTQPTFNCPSNQNVNLNGTCQLIVPNLIYGLTGNDNCGTVTFTQSPLAGASLASSHNQTHNVVITASDGNGNTQTCTVVLTGKDITPPVINCVENIAKTNDLGICGAIVNYASPANSDNCGCVAPTSISGYTLLGTYNGHKYFRSSAGATWTNSKAIANGLGGHLVTINSSGEQLFLQGATNELAWIGFTDEANEGTFVWVTGEPATYTNWLLPSEPNNSGGNENCAVLNGHGTFWNDLAGNNSIQFIIEFECETNTGGVIVTQTGGLPSGSTFPVGLTTNTFLATDAAGNTSTCSFNVTVTDNEKPTVTAPTTVDLECSGNLPAPATTIIQFLALAGSEAGDNCTPQAALLVSSSDGPLVNGNCNGTITRKYTITDAAGNATTVNHVFTVTDNTKPTATAPTTVDLECSSDLPAGKTTIAGFLSLIGANANDNCTPKTDLQVSFVDGPLVNGNCNGTITRTYTITDACSNTITVSHVFTVTDNTKPTTTAPVTVDLECSSDLPAGKTTIAGFLSLTWANANDNCTPQSNLQVSFVDGPLVYGNCNGSITRTYTITDGCGNATTVNHLFTVTDNTKPIVVPPTTIDLECSSNLPAAKTTIAGFLSLVGANANDNCTPQANLLVSSVDGLLVGNNCYGTITRTYTITDACSNTTTVNHVFTVTDNTIPVINTCPGNGVTFIRNTNAGVCTYQVAGTEFNSTGLDNCTGVTMSYSIVNEHNPGTVTGTGSLAGKYLSFGLNTITWIATDGCGNTSLACSVKVDVDKITTTTTLTVSPTSQQYSDLVTFTATVTPNNCTGAGNIGGTVTFKIGSLIIGAAPVINGIATVTDTLIEDMLYDANLNDPMNPTNGPLKPGAKIVTAYFSGTDADYIVTNPTTPLTVTCENADITYNGQTYFSVSPTTNSGTVVLSNYVVDKNDTPTGARGDIRNATATFWQNAINGSVLGTANVPVGLVNPTNKQEGFVTTSFNDVLSNTDISNGGKVYEVWSGLNNYYCENSDTYTPVTLGLPGQDFVTGGGYIVFGNNSAGTYAGTPGKRMNFGFVMKWNSSGKNLQGRVNVVYRKMVNGVQRIYQIKSNAINSLVVENVNDAGSPATGTNIKFRRATISTKANLADITDPLNPISLGGNLNLTLIGWESTTVTTGALDRINVQLSGTGSIGLLFSSNWVSGNTSWQTLNGGKIQVRNPSTPAPGQRTTASEEIITKTTKLHLLIKVFPNPSDNYFNLLVEGNRQEDVVVSVYNVSGVRVHLVKGNANRYYKFGEAWIPGTYLVEVRQGNELKTVKLIKQ